MKTHVEPFALAMLLANAFPTVAATHYVDVNSTNATPPYTDWSTAATNIQDAVDGAVAGDEVVVTNGTYGSGGRDGNRVEVGQPLNIRSVNGAEFTIIDGSGSMRCARLGGGASLSGFTLTYGYVQGDGGGAYGGTLNNCTLIFNSTQLAASATTRGNGGGAAYCTLNNCTLTGNSATHANQSGCNYSDIGNGGGAAFCTLNNCTLRGNSANNQYDYRVCGSSPNGLAGDGGGAFRCTLNNCILTGNHAHNFTGGRSTQVGSGGGAYDCTLNNCIVYFNDASTAGMNYWASYSAFTPNYCCTTPQPYGGIGNITNAPLFVDQANGNLRLQSNSPCINAGKNSYVTNVTDLDGNPRIAGGTVDIGAYEFQAPVSRISYAWLQQYGLPINAATDAADPDGDGVDNWHEWLSGTDPTNRVSSPARLTLLATGTNVLVTWPTNAVGFTLQSATNLGSAAVWVTNSPASVVSGGQNVVTNPVSGPQQFYRLVLLAE